MIPLSSLTVGWGVRNYIALNSDLSRRANSKLFSCIYDMPVAVDEEDPKFQLYWNTSDTQYIDVEIKKLTELDASYSDSGLSASDDFDSFSWSGFAESTVQGYAGYSVDGIANMELDNVAFDFATSIFAFGTEAVLSYGNLTVTVPANGVKFTYDVYNFPWSSTAAKYLDLNVEIKFKAPEHDDSAEEEDGSGNSYSGEDDRRLRRALRSLPEHELVAQEDEGKLTLNVTTIETGGVTVYIISCKGQRVELPGLAIVDDSPMLIDIDISTDGDKAIVDFIFPRFASHLAYDPTLQVASKHSAGFTRSSFNLLGAIAVLAAVMYLR